MQTTRRTFIRGVAAAAPISQSQGTPSGNPPASTADLYIAPTGADEHDGTVDRPFATLDRARRAVLELRSKQQWKRPITVMLRGGTYRLSRPVVFSGRDSGRDTSPTVYLAYPGEQPILSGGEIVRGWKTHQDRIQSAVLPKQEDQNYRFHEVFWNGKRQVCARWPNYDPRQPYYGGWAFIESTQPADAPAAVSFHWEPGAFPRRWSKPHLGRIFIIPGLAWVSNILPIASADFDNRLITTTARLSNRWDRLTRGNRFYVENLLEELDQPGEWCFDQETNTLYFWPPAGRAEDAVVTIPVTDRLIELRASTGEPVRHLRFSGLGFTQTLTLFPNPMALEPDYVDCNRPNSGGYAFYMEGAEHCVVENCRFDQVGGDAIRLHGYNGHNRIAGNEIVEAGAQGICLAHLDFWPYDFPPVWRGQEERLRSVSSRLPWAVGNVISDNHIHHCGVIDNFGAGIHVHGLNCDHNVISHNLIHDMPHHAIYFSMGFGPNEIEYNDVHTLCLVMADAGGIYSNRWCILEGDSVLGNNNVIRFNRIRDVRGVHPFSRKVDLTLNLRSQDRILTPYFTWGIYFDNSPQRALVYGNITEGNVWGGVFLGGGYGQPADCLVENNVLVESSVYQFDLGMKDASRGNRFVRNIVYYQNPEAALLRLQSAEGIRECDYNVYFHAGGNGTLRAVGLPQESFDNWRKLGFDAHSLVADPLFVDAAKGDFRLRPESPAWKVGFKPIPVEKIGPRKP